jgi:class 3 adenylate cyclase
LIVLDRRGTGLSDPVAPRDLPDHETQVADVVAVMDAAGVEQASILGFNDGGGLAVQLAAAYPERCRSLVLWNTAARMTLAPDYPWGAPEAVLLEIVERQAADWADNDPTYLRTLVPSRADDERFLQSLADLGRTAVAPGTVAHFFRETVLADLRGCLADVQAPTLVLQRAQGPIVSTGMGRYVADHIADARYVEIAGTDHMWFSEHGDDVLDEIEEFLTGARPIRDSDRVLATVLFTDIVGSTESAARLGDRGWRDLLAQHQAAVRRELARWRGSEVDTAGDGFLATFDGPARAIRCALAVATDARTIGLEVRGGVHTGECELLGGKVTGIAVHTGARVAALANGGEVLVSQTVKDLVAGSGIEFHERGDHEFKGVPGRWRVYAAADA